MNGKGNCHDNAYTPRRSHSALGGKSPPVYERQTA